MHFSTRFRAWLFIVAVLMLVADHSVLAQPPVWRARGQVNASLLFGATDQQLVGTQADLSRADSTIRLDARVQFRYGESADASGVRSVQARSWLGSLSADARPFALVTPFILGTIESSYEKRLAHRESGGLGVKWTPVRSSTANANFSAALLAEHTTSTAAPATGVRTETSLARWSFRTKADRKIDRASFSQATMYQPEFVDPSRFLLTSATQFAYALTAAFAVTVSLNDNYDSGARARGARSNTDGQLLLGAAVSR
ncbi:MAG: DUF481 domain-containing protein [Gemmatimonadota bacterium]